MFGVSFIALIVVNGVGGVGIPSALLNETALEVEG